MAFTSIVIIVVVLYALGYTGMIIHDLFIKKDPTEFMPKPKDVEIDISDEAGQFKPITVEKSEPKQPSVTAQSTSSHTPEEIVTAHPIADGEPSGKDDGEQSAPPSPPSATPFGSADAKSDGKTSEDFGPRPTDAETQKRINELVKLRRGEMLTDEMTASKDDSTSASGHKTAEVKEKSTDGVEPNELNVRIIGPEHTVSPDVSDAVGKEPSKEKAPSGANSKEATPPTPAPAKKSRPAKPPKPPKQPEFHSDAFFDILKVQIDDTKQHTKLQGAQTAEQVSKEAKRVSPDDAQMALRQITSLWEKKESERVPDEDERQAIEKSERSNREAPPQFNI
ncbi:hypothetical protein [Hallella mizrahii]|uniref:Uncharacterized protein n=1 Tax=Hallella mizrahii TaxID=2606637 RepID=A0A7K0KFH5_9BACT|nr:hypothetical protein [Hallella mizrahii]MST84686.1 hypothetical protein [Hallella mizrahii]